MDSMLKSQAFQAAIDHVSRVHTNEVGKLCEEIQTLRTDLDFTSSLLQKQDAELAVLRKLQADAEDGCNSQPMANAENECRKPPMSEAKDECIKSPMAEDEYEKPANGMNSALMPISPRIRRFCEDTLPMLNGIDKEPVAFPDFWKWDVDADAVVKSELIKISDPPTFSVIVPGSGALQAKPPCVHDFKAPDENDTAGIRTSPQMPNASSTPHIRVSTTSGVSFTEVADDSYKVWTTESSGYENGKSSPADASHEFGRQSFKVVPSMDCNYGLVSQDGLRPSGNRASVHFFDDHVNSEKPMAKQNNHVLSAWAKLVVLMMQAAQQELLQLQQVWVQPESFLLKVMRVHTDIDICAAYSLQKRNFSLRRAMPLRVTSKQRTHELAATIELKNKSCVEYVIMDPQSPKRIVWALIGMILMVYDLIMIPMQAFELDDHPVIDFVAWLSQTFWTLDILVSFFTGVYVNSELEMRFQKIVRAYATTWLPIDSAVTLPLWIVLFLDGDKGQAQASQSIKSAKYVRLLRFLRLARLMKFDHLLSETLEFVNSSTVLLTIGIIKLVFCLALLNHINACLWFAIGNHSGGWVDLLSNSNKGYQYLSAMHWALTQFQGTSDILPGQSTLERLYAATTVLFALILLSAFVSRLTNMMMSLQGLHSKRTQQQRVVRGYLSNHNISASLSVRVKKYVSWKQQLEKNSEYDVEIANVLPPQLMIDLLDEVRHPRLITHEFFKAMHEIYPRVVRKICGDAISTMSPAPGEVVFHAFEACHRMYFAVEGLMSYGASMTRDRHKSNRQRCDETDLAAQTACEADESDRLGTHVEIRKGNFLSEGALWTDWKHCGELSVVKDASLLLLGSEEFKQVVIQNQAAHASAVLYARRFVAVLNRYGFTHSDLIDPLHIISQSDDNDSDMSQGSNDNLRSSSKSDQSAGARSRAFNGFTNFSKNNRYSHAIRDTIRRYSMLLATGPERRSTINSRA